MTTYFGLAWLGAAAVAVCGCSGGDSETSTTSGTSGPTTGEASSGHGGASASSTAASSTASASSASGQGGGGQGGAGGDETYTMQPEDTACRACMKASCCAQLEACAVDPTCLSCWQCLETNAGMPAACDALCHPVTDAPTKAASQCAAAKCATPCGS